MTVNVIGACLAVAGAAVYHRLRIEGAGIAMCILGLLLMMNEGWAVWA